MSKRLLLLILAIGIFSSLSHAEPVEVNGIAAKVNGRVITVNQVSFLLSPIFAQLSTKYPGRGSEFVKEFELARKKVIDELIEKELIIEEAKKRGASYSATIVDEDIKRQINELYGGDEQKFREELKKSRLTMEGFREMTREKMIVQALRSQQLTDVAPPLPNEIHNEYEKAKESMRDTTKDIITLQRIMIPAQDPENPGATPEDQLKLAQELVDRINKGEDFTEIAKNFSKGPFSEIGGLQENVERGYFTNEFASIIFDAPLNKVIGPLLDKTHFTIVKVVSKKLGPPPPLSQVRSIIEERVSRNKTSAEYKRWIEARRKRAIIEIY